MNQSEKINLQEPATAAKAATNTPICSNSSKCSNSKYFEIAQNRLSLLSRELNHPLEDILDWYKNSGDMETLGMISMSDARRYVTEYVQHIDLCRCD